MPEWRRLDEFTVGRGPWRVAKCRVGGRQRFVLTHDERVRALGLYRPVHEAWYFDDGAAARTAAEDMDKGAGGYGNV